MIHFVETDLLRIAYLTGGSSSGMPVLLLHGWPDAPMAWEQVAKRLHNAGYRTISPWLRGSFPTEFLSAKVPRSGSFLAMAQDVIDLADRLRMDHFSVLGHDWGARIAYALAALFPERIRVIAALSLPYPVRGEFGLSTFAQSRCFWYQFFQCTEAGEQAVRNDPIGFARIQWETWGPAGWFTEHDFEQASEHFSHPDWVEITLNAYRSRYLTGETIDHRYDHLSEKIRGIETIGLPTLMIQGSADSCDLPFNSEGQERFFLSSYRRLLLDSVGHFPHREAPATVAEAAIHLLSLAEKSL